MYDTVTDYETVGQNKLTFSRSYNSLASAQTYATTLGPHWRSNYDRYLRILSPTAIVAERADGQQVGFSLVSGVWTPDSDVDLTLTQSGSTWTLTDGTDTAETYTASGAQGTLQSIKLRNGYQQNLTYSGGQLANVTDSYGRALNFTYTGSLLTGVTTPDSLVLNYGYTATAGTNVLTSVGYNTSPATSQTYLYENASFPFALTGITDENGARFATWAYDGTGRATSSKNGDTLNANLTQIAYDDATGNRTVTLPDGEQNTYKFTMLQGVPKVTEIDRAANGTLAAATRSFAYDTNGYQNDATDWNGNHTSYVNDAHGQPTTINAGIAPGGGTPLRTTTIAYDPTWVHLPGTITEQGLTTANAYDGTTGNLLTRTQTDTTSVAGTYSPASRVWAYGWGTGADVGLLKSVVNPRTDLTMAQRTTGFTYDHGALASTTNGLGQTVTINTHTGGGRPLTMHDPNGVLTTLAYNPRQWLTSSALTMAAGVRTTGYTYDGAGDLTNTALPDYITIANTYDAAHRRTNVTWPLSETLNDTLDAAGNVTARTIKTGTHLYYSHTSAFDASAAPASDTDAYGNATHYTNDNNGNPVTVTDPRGHATSTVFDALNRATQVTDRGGGVSALTWNPRNFPLTALAANGALTTYVRDGFDELVQEISPDRGTTSWHYDAMRNPVSQTDALGTVANYTTDALNRRTAIAYPAAPAENITTTYDQPGHGFGIGRLTGMTDPAGSYSPAYDERGALTTESRTRGSLVRTTGYGYDAAGLPNTTTYPDGMVVTQNRDAAGQVRSVQLKASATGTQQNLATSIGHTLFGPSGYAAFGNGVTESRLVDLNYRMAQVYVSNGSANLVSKALAFDANSNPTGITDGVTSANSETLTYNAMDQMLTAATPTGGYGTRNYTYDLNGNRIGSPGGDFTIAANSNRITKIHNTGVGTNATGNITSLPSISGVPAMGFTYTKANRLATVTSGGATLLSNVYDGFGQRVTKTDSAQRYLQYAQDGTLLENTDNLGNVQQDYIYLDGRPIATYSPNTGAITYLHADNLGTPILATDASKTVIWDMTKTDPFASPNTPATGNSISPELRLPGQEAELGLTNGFNLNHNGARDYAPALGRYLESDPTGLAAGFNTYTYAGQNPKKFVDPTGQTTNNNNSLNGSNTPFIGNISYYLPKCIALVDCVTERQEAVQYCSEIFSMPSYSRPPSIWGGSLNSCIMGQISQICGGNKLSF